MKVISKEVTMIKACKMFGIKYPTAKCIMQNFRKDGRIDKPRLKNKG